MATVKLLATVPIVNPKDPTDLKPWIANVEDVSKRGWTLWADRHAVAAATVEEVREPAKEPKVPAAENDGKPADESEGNKPAVNPSEVKKGPGKKS